MEDSKHSYITQEERDYLENSFFLKFSSNSYQIPALVQSESCKTFIAKIVSEDKKKKLRDFQYKTMVEEFLKEEEKKIRNQIIPPIQNPSNVGNKAQGKINKEEGEQKKENDERINLLEVTCLIEYDENFRDYLNNDMVRENKGQSLRSLIQDFVSFYIRNPIEANFEQEIHEVKYDIKINDELGEWNYNPFQNIITIKFKQRNQEKFSRKFKIIDPIIKFTSVPNLQQDKPKMEDFLTLQTFLIHIISKYNKDFKYLEKWKQFFEEHFIDNIKELFDLSNNDWEKLKMKPLLKKIIREELAYIESIEKEKPVYSEAQKLSMIHRLERFLFYKLYPKEIKNISDLSPMAVRKGFQEIKEEYVGEELLSELEKFYSTFTIPRSYSKSLDFSMGNILYGPPGTGKTKLTETLPLKIGLTPISPPICSAEVNRSHVGETERLLIDLFGRAKKVPYLLCCVSIDEIDSLVPKREDKSSESKIDSMSILLSLLGGIKQVDNIILIASTNRLNKIDDAFKRRLSGQYFVGRPSPLARKYMMDRAVKLDLSEQLKEEAKILTTNFSGAALKQLISDLVIIGAQTSKAVTFQQLTQNASEISKRFNIRLGSYSLPEIFSNHRESHILFHQNLYNDELKGVRVLQIFPEQCSLKMFYLKKRRNLRDNGRDAFSFEIYSNETTWDKSRSFDDELKSILKKEGVNGEIFSYDKDLKAFEKDIIENLIIQLKDQEANARTLYKSKGVRKVILWKEFTTWIPIIKNAGDSLYNLIFKNQNTSLIHIFMVSSKYEDQKSVFDFLNWSNNVNIKLHCFDDNKFTGRIMVDLSNINPYLLFETERESRNHYNIVHEDFHKHAEKLNASSVVPILTEFATKRGIDFIILMDLDFLMLNSAYDDSKMLENINEKMVEFSAYSKAMLIVDYDSLIGISRSTTNSSTGPSTSSNMIDPRIHKIVVHYANNYARFNKNQEYWVSIIVSNKELATFIRQDINFPLNHEAFNDEKEEYDRKYLPLECVRCKKKYTEDKNDFQSCNYHDGFVIKYDQNLNKFETREKAEVDKVVCQSKRQNPEPIYKYICCSNTLESQGCKNNKHIASENQWQQECKNVFWDYENKFNSLKLKFI